MGQGTQTQSSSCCSVCRVHSCWAPAPQTPGSHPVCLTVSRCFLWQPAEHRPQELRILQGEKRKKGRVMLPDSVRPGGTWWVEVGRGGNHLPAPSTNQGREHKARHCAKRWGRKKEFLFIIYTPPTSKENFKGDSQWKPHMKQDHWVKNWIVNPWKWRKEACVPHYHPAKGLLTGSSRVQMRNRSEEGRPELRERQVTRVPGYFILSYIRDHENA